MAKGNNPRSVEGARWVERVGHREWDCYLVVGGDPLRIGSVDSWDDKNKYLERGRHKRNGKWKKRARA